MDYVDELRPGARRFDMGEFSQFTLLPMSVAAVTQVLEWGVPRIAAGIGALTSRIARRRPRWAARCRLTRVASRTSSA